METTGTMAGAGRAGPVWIIDEEQWPRACLRAELIERGYDAVGFEAIADAVPLLASARHRRPRMVIVDVTNHALTDEEAAQLSGSGATLVAIGHGTGTLGPAFAGPSAELHWAAFLHRPVDLRQVADTADALLGRAVSMPRGW